MNANNRSAGSAVTLSCEFFPPRTEAGVEKLLITQQSLEETFQPEYFSVTFGAGGSTQDGTCPEVYDRYQGVQEMMAVAMQKGDNFLKWSEA